MNIELLLAMENAENYNQQRRVSQNIYFRKQTVVNLTDGILPYRVPTAANFVNCNISNREMSSSSETIYTYHHSYDIGFDPVLTGHCMEKAETDVLDDDQEDDNLILLNELVLSEHEHVPLPLHPFTNLSTREFCTNLVRTFREANLCKTYSSRMLQLIHSALPQPNNLPTFINALFYIYSVASII